MDPSIECNISRRRAVREPPPGSDLAAGLGGGRHRRAAYVGRAEEGGEGPGAEEGGRADQGPHHRQGELQAAGRRARRGQVALRTHAGERKVTVVTSWCFVVILRFSLNAFLINGQN